VTIFKLHEENMDLSKTSITQLAAIVGAIGTIIGAGFAIDSRYAKRDEIDALKKELRVTVDTLHKKILENEQLKQDLGDNAQVTKVLAERNRQELAEIKARLLQESSRIRVFKTAPSPTQMISPSVEEKVDNNQK
jgi:hypothetical protein